MRLQTDRSIEIVRLVKTGDTYAEAKDPDDPTRNAPAINEGREFAPEFEAKAGDLLLIKVLA
jgi:hypothetical protein